MTLLRFGDVIQALATPTLMEHLLETQSAADNNRAGKGSFSAMSVEDIGPTQRNSTLLYGPTTVNLGSYFSTRIDTTTRNASMSHVKSSMTGIVPRNAYLFFIYFFYIFGLFGNAMVFALMHRRFSSATYSVFLRFLAMVDSLVLISTCTEDVLDHQFHILSQFLTSSTFICGSWSYLHYVSCFLSPWYVVAFTFDRFMVVVFPLVPNLFGTVRRTSLVCVIMLLLACAEGLSKGLTVTIENERDGKDCHSFTFNQSLVIYFSVRGVVLQALLPCSIIFVLNVFIIIKTRQSAAFRKSMTTSDSQHKMRSRDKKLTMSLVVISLMGFLTLIPISVVEMLEFVWVWGEGSHGSVGIPHYLSNAHRTWPLLNLVALMNFSQNFYLLILTSARYRKGFLAMVCPGRLGRGLRGHPDGKGDSSSASRGSSSSSRDSNSNRIRITRF